MLSIIDSPGLRNLIFVFLAASVGSKRFGQSLLHNTAVIEEHPTVMSCRIYPGSQISQWVFTSTRSTTHSTLYSKERGVGLNFSRIYFVLSTKLTSTLRINKTQLDDAGIYQCKLMRNNSDGIPDIVRESAHLIVLRQEPTCRTNFPTQVSEFTIIEMNCSVEFRGYWFPVMEWRQNAADGPLITDGVNSTAVSNASVHSTLKLLANRTTNKMKYVCKTYFTKYEGIDKVEATNIPDYNYTWMSPQLNVTYGPQNVNITPSGNEFEFGDELTCSAYSNPEAMYEWKNASGSHLFHGPTLKLDEKIANQQNVTLVCIATNVVSNATAQVTVYRKKSAWNRLVVLATVLSAVFLVILLIFASIIAYLVRSKKGRSEASVRDGVPGPVERLRFDNTSNPAVNESNSSVVGLELTSEFRTAAELSEATEALEATEDLAQSPEYVELAAREIALPHLYDRLGKDRQAFSVDKVQATAAKISDYVNVPFESTEEEYEAMDEYYNVTIVRHC